MDGVLVGIHWKGKGKPHAKELVELFESKYKIHFKRKFPKGLSDGDYQYHDGAYDFSFRFDRIHPEKGIDKTPYAYEDKDVRIYIKADRTNFFESDYNEEVAVFLGNFEEIIKQGKVRVETERLSKPADIPGSDSL